MMPVYLYQLGLNLHDLYILQVDIYLPMFYFSKCLKLTDCQAPMKSQFTYTEQLHVMEYATAFIACKLKLLHSEERIHRFKFLKQPLTYNQVVG